MSRITDCIDLITNQLLNGQVAAIPTETVYGLAACANDNDGIEQIYAIKKRPRNHPLIMHVGHNWDISLWVDAISELAIELMKTFWPGPLTLVFNLKENSALSPLATAGQKTIAIRCPAHPITLELLNQLKTPMVAPSANPFGRISPTRAEHVLEDFPDESFYILNGGACQVGIESTILDVTEQNQCRILRAGIITEHDLTPFVSISNLKTHERAIAVPGRLKYHYQPRKPAFHIAQINELDPNLLKESFVLAFSDLNANTKQRGYCFSSNMPQSAQVFYHQLRIADASNAKQILIELPPNKAEWCGLRERILKASHSIHELTRK